MDNIERSENCYPTKYVVNLGIFGPVIQCSIVDKGLFTWPNTIDGTILSFRSSRDNIDQISIRIKTHHLLVCLNFVSLIPFSRQIEFPRWMDSTEETISSFRPFDNNNFRNTVFEKEKTRGEEDRGKIRRSFSKSMVLLSKPAILRVYTFVPPVSPLLKQTFLEIFLLEALLVRNSFIVSMSPICKTEHSLHTLYSTDRSLRSSPVQENFGLKSFSSSEVFQKDMYATTW